MGRMRFVRPRVPEVVLEQLQHVGLGRSLQALRDTRTQPPRQPRIGGSLGSDRHGVVGGVHAGYEHSYSLRKGWQVYWQVKSDLMIGGEDLFRTGVVIGVKLPVK